MMELLVLLEFSVKHEPLMSVLQVLRKDQEELETPNGSFQVRFHFCETIFFNCVKPNIVSI